MKKLSIVFNMMAAILLLLSSCVHLNLKDLKMCKSRKKKTN